MHNQSSHRIDRLFLFSVGSLVIIGFVIFLSASLGLLAKDGGNFGIVAIKQAVSLGIGIVAFFVFSKINYHYMKRFAFFILVGAIFLNLLLFIPGIGLEHGGAVRWIDLGFISFQPSEFLKFAFVIYMAAWLHAVKDRVKHMRYGLIPFIGIMGILGILLLTQPDTDTLVIVGFSGILMLLVSGLPIKHLAVATGLMLVVIIGVVAIRPYAFDRIKTFFDIGADAQGSGYQITQSRIAIGSGQFSGRGFGQSVQKFGYLPEPVGDSIFAVAAEEFGFVGGIVIVGFYVLLALSVFRISARAPDLFGSLLSLGIVVLIVTESFMNIAAMVGIIPLSGLPLLFISHGGTALILVLTACGIVANVSRYARV